MNKPGFLQMLILLAILQSVLINNLPAQNWIQTGENIEGESAGDQSGKSICLNSDGSVIAIGAPFNSDNGYNTGHTRVYEIQQGTWIQIGNDIDGEGVYDESGSSVSLSDDGTVLAIGAPHNNNYSGHVRVYENQGGSWVQIGQDIEGVETYDKFGFSVSLNSNGSIIAIGAIGSIVDPVGYTEVYENQSGNWIQLGNSIIGETYYDGSGYSVSLNYEGTRMAIGAPYNPGNGTSSGHVRIFEYLEGSWVQIGEDIDGEMADDQSGHTVSLNSDGTFVTIGAPFNSGNGEKSGQVRIFENQGNDWVQVGEDIDGEFDDDRFGWSVSIDSDGTTVAIGAPGNDGNGDHSGHVRVFENQGNDWVQVGEDIDGEAALDSFGFSTGLSSDGNVVAAGAIYNDGNGSSAGHVKVCGLLVGNSETTIPVTKVYSREEGSIVIQLDEPTSGEAQIFNTLGLQVATSGIINSGQNTILLNSSGYYIVRIICNNHVITEKVWVE